MAEHQLVPSVARPKNPTGKLFLVSWLKHGGSIHTAQLPRPEYNEIPFYTFHGQYVDVPNVLQVPLSANGLLYLKV